MPSLIHNGIRYSQTCHAIYCKKCKTVIESKHRHDFKMCPCKAVGVDGGIALGNRVIGELSDMESRAKYLAVVNKIKIWLSPEIIQHYFTTDPIPYI
jgi:hypothetical protein